MTTEERIAQVEARVAQLEAALFAFAMGYPYYIPRPLLPTFPQGGGTGDSMPPNPHTWRSGELG